MRNTSVLIAVGLITANLTAPAVVAQVSNNLSCGELSALTPDAQRRVATDLLNASGITPTDARIALLVRTCSRNAAGLVQDAISGDSGPD